ncbi:MAG TPA: thioredoxin family protein [Ignavibacteriales bacterium]|nr:thioredoxin family protein [Ignavibacteriales bacterium]
MRKLLIIAVSLTIVTTLAFAQAGSPKKKQAKKSIAKVTFIELGSVNCIPCRQMQPVMKAVEKNYGEQVKVIFYDVWKEEQRQYAEKYGIKLIPTQVFLDGNGKEFFRHEGFYPESEINKLLISRGLKPVNKKG